jgi:hypothetical protein
VCALGDRADDPPIRRRGAPWSTSLRTCSVDQAAAIVFPSVIDKEVGVERVGHLNTAAQEIPVSRFDLGGSVGRAGGIGQAFLGWLMELMFLGSGSVSEQPVHRKPCGGTHSRTWFSHRVPCYESGGPKPGWIKGEDRWLSLSRGSRGLSRTS